MLLEILNTEIATKYPGGGNRFIKAIVKNDNGEKIGEIDEDALLGFKPYKFPMAGTVTVEGHQDSIQAAYEAGLNAGLFE